MDEKRFDEVLGDLPRSFNPPAQPPLDEMWAVIEDAHFNAPASASSTRRMWWRSPWLAVAAALVIGIGIGHYIPSSANTTGNPPPASMTAAADQPAGDTSAVVDAYRDQTSHYLGQAAALLISLPAKDASGKADAAFAGKAAELLVTTRLLLDSPAAQDPKLRSLLDDLELVLVQIARLRSERSRGDLDLIHQAVEQGDVLSRLNSAAVTNQSSE
ncbi:MAG: hypothetical protein QOH22_1178 [Gemmatimonadaceae bacterium]|nr:hypothetical protein [Gemmatimonadaceae bacterium]MEA2765782.1 hypothetical protein [Gemmatimonadaceae bacterium]